MSEKRDRMMRAAAAVRSKVRNGTSRDKAISQAAIASGMSPKTVKMAYLMNYFPESVERV